MEWIENYLGDEAHNEKGEKKKQVPVEQAKKKRKVEQKGKFFVQKVKMKCKELMRTYLSGSS